MPFRPCLDCGTPSEGSRCREHEAERLARRGNSDARGYDGRWRRLSHKARRLQPFCGEPGGCDFGISPKNPLTVHHLRWPATGPADVEVLCLTHNNRRGKAAR